MRDQLCAPNDPLDSHRIADNALALNPQRLHGPVWHVEAKTPIVDGKYVDPMTGELCSVDEPVGGYMGPPGVDIIIKGLHADTAGCTLRAARHFPFEAILQQIMKVVRERNIALDSLTATPYAIRVITAQAMTREEFYEAAGEMVTLYW